MSTRVVLCEDNFLVREGISRLLASTAAFDVVAVCEDFASGLAAIDEFRPDVVLTDIRMPPRHRDEGIQLAQHCRRSHPRTGVLLLSQYVEPGYVKELLTQGTEGRGYLLKERVADVADLVEAVEAVARGESAIDPKVVEALVQGRARAGDGALVTLTPREREVLGLIAQGRTNVSIAQALVLSPKAVEKHINSIFAKLGLSGDRENHPRVRAALMYLAEGGGARN